MSEHEEEERFADHRRRFRARALRAQIAKGVDWWNLMSARLHMDDLPGEMHLHNTGVYEWLSLPDTRQRHTGLRCDYVKLDEPK